MTLEGGVSFESFSREAQRRPMPSEVRVPLPNSSMMHSDLQNKILVITISHGVHSKGQDSNFCMPNLGEPIQSGT